MKTALFGGSFNPPHIAHQLICFHLLEYKQFNRIYLIPVYKHPFRKDLVSFEHRWEMCVLLAKPFGERVITTGAERYLVKYCNGKGHTIDTVRDFKTRYPEDSFTLIIGSDVSDELNKWKDVDEINKLVTITTYPRMTHLATGQKVSSTEIRRRIGQKESIAELVPDSIRKYIKKNRLYTK